MEDLHFYMITVVPHFDIQFNSEEITDGMIDDVEDEYKIQLEGELGVDDTFTIDDIDWDHKDDTFIVKLFVSSTLEKSEMVDKFVELITGLDKFHMYGEIQDGTYYDTAYVFDTPPYQRIYNTKEIEYDVIVANEVTSFEETDIDGNLVESVTKDELKKRAEIHRKKQDGLSPFCSLGESGYKSGDKYYGGLPADPDYAPIKSARYYKEITNYFENKAKDDPRYKVKGKSDIALVLATPEGDEVIDLTRFDALADAEEAIDMARHYVDETLTEAKKKNKKYNINYNAGNVEHNINMFNKMNSPVEGPTNNPVSGPFGGDVAAPAGGSMGEALELDTCRYNVTSFNFSPDAVTLTCVDTDNNEEFEKFLCGGLRDEDTGRRNALMLLKDTDFCIPLDIKNELISTYGLDDFGYTIVESARVKDMYKGLDDRFDMSMRTLL